MDIAVIISGVADPKWPLPQDLSVASLHTHTAAHAALSPFDEAALELALSLRDAHADVRVTALVAADEGLTRRVAGFRPDHICRIGLDAVARWDSGALAAALAQALAERAAGASLVLVGREFGDFDDGTVPALLARAGDWAYAPLALDVDRKDDGFDVLRQGPGGLERVRLPAHALLCATNDPGNRLRHPLMKNVMLAKRAAFDVWRAAPAASALTLQLQAIAPAPAPPRPAACEWIEGSAAEKAQALAQWLMKAARA